MSGQLRASAGLPSGKEPVVPMQKYAESAQTAVYCSLLKGIEPLFRDRPATLMTKLIRHPDTFVSHKKSPTVKLKGTISLCVFSLYRYYFTRRTNTKLRISIQST